MTQTAKPPRGWRKKQIGAFTFDDAFVREIDDYSLEIGISLLVSYIVKRGPYYIVHIGSSIPVAEAARRAVAAVKQDQADLLRAGTRVVVDGRLGVSQGHLRNPRPHMVGKFPVLFDGDSKNTYVDEVAVAVA
jgi:hypothetical protein